MATAFVIEDGLNKIDAAIARKKMIADDKALPPFTAAENMEIYDCVYKLCKHKALDDRSLVLYDKYMSCIEERIMEKVIPRLLGKHGAALLTEVTESWSEFKALADSLYKCFEYLDRFNGIKSRPSLNDAARRCFCDQVCERLYGKIQEATMSLIFQEREGNDIDRNLLKAVFNFFVAMRGKETIDYYEKFEHSMLAEAATYYSELCIECWFWRDSYTNYLRKVDWCLVQEEARAEVYPCERTKTKLLDVMKYVLLERNAKRWAQKRKADGIADEDHELLSKYASLSLDVGTSASASVLVAEKCETPR